MLKFKLQENTLNCGELIDWTDYKRGRAGEREPLNKRPSMARSLFRESVERNCCCWL